MAELENILSRYADHIAALETRLRRIDEGQFPVIERPVVGKFVVWFGVAVFSMWAGIVLYDPTVMNATPLSFLADLFGRSPYGLSFALLSSAIAAVVGIYSERTDFVARTLLFPIVFLMLIASSGSMRAIIVGHYADQTVRSWTFIFADQLPWIVSSLIYVVALLQQFGRGVNWTRGFESWKL